MEYRIVGLDPAPFAHLFSLDDAALAGLGAERVVVDAPHAFPDRVELRDLEPGERAILVNHVHQPAATPYRASHAIFVREGATTAYDRVGPLPEVLRRRTLSLRAFDDAGVMRDASLVPGTEAGPALAALFADARVAYVQAHYAVRGCYAARIERA